MSMEKELNDVIAKIEADMTGFIAASVVDLESGMTLAARSARSDFDLAVASAYNSELVKQKMKIVKALNLKTNLEDVLLTLGDQLHLIKIFPGGHTFLYLAADRASTNLAIVRNSVNRHVATLQH
jgi:predicted regulator of Ras-like GTPase activity (Roadblock/LC7/MglB family)